MSASHNELFRLTATEAVALLKRGDITPLDLIDAAERRIAEVEPAINALPTLCVDRAREHARRLMRGESREAEGEPGWLGGLPVAIKDLADVAGVRTTYGSPIFKDHVPKTSHPVVERIERKGGVVIAKSNTPELGAGGHHDRLFAFCLAQFAAMMTTATAMRARWAARNTSEGKSRLVIRQACHRAPPAAIAASIYGDEKRATWSWAAQSCGSGTSGGER